MVVVATTAATVTATETTTTMTMTATATAVRGERALGGATDHCERGGASDSDKGQWKRMRCCCCYCWCCCCCTTAVTASVYGDTRRRRRRYGCAVTAIIKLRTAAASPLTGTEKYRPPCRNVGSTVFPYVYAVPSCVVRAARAQSADLRPLA